MQSRQPAWAPAQKEPRAARQKPPARRGRGVSTTAKACARPHIAPKAAPDQALHLHNNRPTSSSEAPALSEANAHIQRARWAILPSTAAFRPSATSSLIMTTDSRPTTTAATAARKAEPKMCQGAIDSRKGPTRSRPWKHGRSVATSPGGHGVSGQRCGGRRKTKPLRKPMNMPTARPWQAPPTAPKSRKTQPFSSRCAATPKPRPEPM
mmetsp:Transcript_49427/g.147618  ORF Transcript_49427/g.147618 Transcript_49427/m.147618 type:complete len:209 (+) Transcript_49427:100-726(+)